MTTVEVSAEVAEQMHRMSGKILELQDRLGKCQFALRRICSETKSHDECRSIAARAWYGLPLE